MLNRRQFLTLGVAGFTVSTMSTSSRANDNRVRLLFVHGRGQGGENPSQLRSIWLATLSRGGRKLVRELPAELEVAFPYYGDTLDNFSRQFEIPLTSDIQTRGSPVNEEFLRFQGEIAEALRLRAGITDAQVDQEYGPNAKPKGPLNWEWVQATLRALDKYGPGASQRMLENFTRDVFLYTTRAGVRDEIDRIVAAALTEAPTVVVGHSLGSVVAYNVLRADRRLLQVPAFVTVARRSEFVRSATCCPLRFPSPASAWYNAFDDRDVVALYPLDMTNFPVTPMIENHAWVAGRIFDALGV